MADTTQEPLLPAPGGAESPSTAGDPVRSSHGARVLSWFRRFRREKKPAPRLTDAAPPPLSPESLAAAAVRFAAEAARGSAFVDEAKSFADAARAFADAEEPRALRFAEDLMERASTLAVAADLRLQEWMSIPTSTAGLAVKAICLSMDSQMLPGVAPAASRRDVAGPEEHLQSASRRDVAGPEEHLQSLLRRARQFNADSSGTTMYEAAKHFYQAAQAFSSRSHKYEKIRDIPLSQAAMDLSAVASVAPLEEKWLALIAQKLEADASVLVLEEINPTLVQNQVKKRTCMQWPLACISIPSLPLHRHQVKRQEKLSEKRQVIFGILLSTPIALLTTMKAGSALPPEHTVWVGGVSATIWVLVNAGFMMNLYGKTQFELSAPQHVSRLGMLGLAILVCLYMYWWFFPSLEVLFWTLLGVVALFHCIFWIVGCWRHDDDNTLASPADDECTCSRCRPCTCACRDLESSG